MPEAPGIFHPPLLPRTGRGPWTQAPHNPPPGTRYMLIATSREPPQRGDLNRLAWGTDPSTPQRRWQVRQPTYQEANPRSLKERKPTPDKPSRFSRNLPPSRPNRMDLSANRAGRSLPGVRRDVRAAQREQSAFPRRNQEVSPPPGGGPRQEACPGRRRDGTPSSRG